MLRFLLLFVLLFGLGGCSGGGSSTGGMSIPQTSSSSQQSNPPTVDPNAPATLVIQHLLLARSVPSSIGQFRFCGLDAAGHVLFGPITASRSSQEVIPQVPLATRILRIEYLQSGIVVGCYHQSLSLSPASTVIIADPAWQDLAAAVEAVLISPPSAAAAAGQTRLFVARARFRGFGELDLSNNSVQWESSQTQRATIDSHGLATSISPGPTQITARYGTISGSATLTVDGRYLASLTISPDNPSTPNGISTNLLAQANFSDNSHDDFTTSVEWESSDPLVAEIDNGANKGKIIPHKVGTTHITVTQTSSGLSTGVDFRVTDAVPVNLSVSPQNQLLAPGHSRQFHASAQLSDGLQADLTNQVTWSTGDNQKLTVTPGGLVSAIGPVGQQVQVTASLTQPALSASTTVYLNQFLYVTCGQNHLYTTFSVNPATGGLTFLRNVTPTPSETIWDISMHPNGKWCYMTHAETGFIEGYSIDPSNGALTRLPGSPWTIGYRLFGCDITPDGSKIMAARVNANSIRPGDVTTFSIDPETGSLGNQITTGAVDSTSSNVFISPNGKFAYVSYSANYGFRGLLLDGLSFIAGSPFSTGIDDSMGFSADSAALYVVDHLDTLRAYLIDQATGGLTKIQTLTTVGHYGVLVTPDSRHLYTCEVNPSQIDGFVINPADYTLSLIAGSPFNFPSNDAPRAPISSNDGRFVYVLSNAGLRTFSRDLNTGALTQVQSTPINGLARNQALSL